MSDQTHSCHSYSDRNLQSSESFDGFKQSENTWYPRELEIFLSHDTWFCLANVLLGWILLEGSVKIRPRFIECYIVTGFIQLLTLIVFLTASSVTQKINIIFILPCSVIAIWTHFLLCVNAFLQNLYEKAADQHSILPSLTEKV